jgi:hypothetical protein
MWDPKRQVPCNVCKKLFAAAGLSKHQKSHGLLPARPRGPTFYCPYHRKRYARGTEKRHYLTHKSQHAASRPCAWPDHSIPGQQCHRLAPRAPRISRPHTSVNRQIFSVETFATRRIARSVSLKGLRDISPTEVKTSQ